MDKIKIKVFYYDITNKKTDNINQKSDKLENVEEIEVLGVLSKTIKTLGLIKDCKLKFDSNSENIIKNLEKFN